MSSPLSLDEIPLPALRQKMSLCLVVRLESGLAKERGRGGENLEELVWFLPACKYAASANQLAPLPSWTNGGPDFAM